MLQPAITRLHDIDKKRTIVHDYDRAGDYYSTWCLCGQQLTSRVPCWKNHYMSEELCTESVMYALKRHLAKVNA